ncbi:ATP-binding cassette domain-containing protein [Paenibacillus sp. 481]|uniref:ATP-binding cassette domain-containing protein n=1 Tax=Paenibacillus sp. 481 TaxID=2835869 RepID=UPI001E65CD15|nr:ABC transporter ATP-binding protein [Paenibacillus sp. 481]UHA74936.1 ABC transporter ATP-binding protein [Paenibacillus sp. 481]
MRLSRVTFSYVGAGAARSSSLHSLASVHSLDIEELAIRRGEVLIIAGANGSGKTTLCKLLARTLRQHHGSLQGTVWRADCGDVIGEEWLSAPTDCGVEVGLVLQDPDEQFVIGTVEDEIAFGPENVGLPPEVIVSRMEEQLHAARLVELRERSVLHLSGGEKQRVALAAMLALEPELLIIDDAWSHMDAASYAALETALKQWHNSERTLILAMSRLDEQRTQRWPAARVIQLAQGRLQNELTKPNKLSEPNNLTQSDQMDQAEHIPPVVTEDSILKDASMPDLRNGEHNVLEVASILEVKSLSYSYAPTARKHSQHPTSSASSRNDSGVKPTLDHVSFTMRSGQCHILHGCNGSGKSTLFRLLTKSLRMQHGSISLCGRELHRWNAYELSRLIGYVPQRPEYLFFADTVWEEYRQAIQDAQQAQQVQQAQREQQGHSGTHKQPEQPEHHGQRVRADHSIHAAPLDELIERMLMEDELWSLRHLHPHDLHAGAKRKMSLRLATVHAPALILLDEPTAGLDLNNAQYVRTWCLQQAQRGSALLIATHDELWDEINEAQHSLLKRLDLVAGNLIIK